MEKRDFIGSITYLKYNKKDEFVNQLWSSYCFFHLGEYDKSLEIYKSLLSSFDDKKKKMKIEWENRNQTEIEGELIVYKAICEFLLGEYEASKASLNEFKDLKFGKKKSEHVDKLNELVFRLELHLAHKFNDEELIESLKKNMQESIPNQLCLASIHYLSARYQGEFGSFVSV